MESVLISKDKSLLDIPYLHRFLTKAYWSSGRTLEQVQRSIDTCICFGVYFEDRQIGFARILSDHVVFTYIMDVFIDPEYRGQGYSMLLLEAIHKDPELIETNTWYLKTRDAHELYHKFGYEGLQDVNVWMERKKTKI